MLISDGRNRPRESDTPLELRLLGPFELSDPDPGALIAISAEKMRALIAYLAAAPRLTAPRRELAELLWANEDGRGRHSLRQLLSNFRRTAPARASDILTYDDVTVSLIPSKLKIDRSAVLDVSSNADLLQLRTAADQYRGEFIAGLSTGETNFDDWLQVERTRMRDAAVALIDRLVRALIVAGQHQDALNYANRLVTIDSLREETHRLVLSQEAIVSGRASAMARYEIFRQLLGNELGVAPERATRDLINGLRESSFQSKSPSSQLSPIPPGQPVETRRAGPTEEVVAVPLPAPATEGLAHSTNPRRKLPISATVAAILLLSIVGGAWHLRGTSHPTFVGEDAGRVSVVLLPFATGHAGDQTAKAYEAESNLAFARDNRLSLVEFTGNAPSDAVSAGHRLHARYVVKTTIGEASDKGRADVGLFDTETGTSVAATTISLTGGKLKFARELFRYIYPEIALHRARTLAAVAPDSISTLLWRAEAARIKTRVGATDPEEFKLFEAVLTREPNQLYALLGLAGGLILKVAREQSENRAEDIAAAAALLTRAREQAPNMPTVAFAEGMLNKLQGRFEQAGIDFERAFRLDRTHWNAAAQAAHVKIFLGRFEEAYTEMETATDNLLPDIGAAETAYIAGETALVAGHPNRAVEYLAMAIGGNAKVSRIHGMYAAALWMAGREEEARAAAARSQSLSPSYSPALMARRGRATARPRYQAARDVYVEAFRAALAPVKASTD